MTFFLYDIFGRRVNTFSSYWHGSLLNCCDNSQKHLHYYISTDMQSVYATPHFGYTTRLLVCVAHLLRIYRWTAYKNHSVTQQTQNVAATLLRRCNHVVCLLDRVALSFTHSCCINKNRVGS